MCKWRSSHHALCNHNSHLHVTEPCLYSLAIPRLTSYGVPQHDWIIGECYRLCGLTGTTTRLPAGGKCESCLRMIEEDRAVERKRWPVRPGKEGWVDGDGGWNRRSLWIWKGDRFGSKRTLNWGWKWRASYVGDEDHEVNNLSHWRVPSIGPLLGEATIRSAWSPRLEWLLLS